MNKTSLAALCIIAMSMILVGCEKPAPQTQEQKPSTPVTSSNPAPAAPAPSAAVPTAVSATPSEPVPEVKLDSPDHAVQSWWRMRDHILKLRNQKCTSGGYDSFASRLAPLADGPAKLDVEKASSCTLEIFDREIQEVKTESETRAVVFARIKNVTPIPSGATPDEIHLKWRRDGEKIRYVLEKTSAGWKVSQIFMYKDYTKQWTPVFESNPKPYIPALVSSQEV